ncbi:amino acid ABC transporter substrate-binding protein/permease [Weissella tructae]|uniref:Glutamine-binding protein / Glutamine transport system permease protein n=2 Tax=Weissella TaxID=46255 RepID=A0A075TY52_9LACO|nr:MULTISPECIES: amino acid ABC transporter substrate-binding protein/permease [Weissella]AIG65140.1 Glutamine-binding protein / Glutamine transport system permease protein [Weissella tructae]AIM62453.1 Glutamine-binding protein / Glutamine transport system permease protein [Weissella ceti]ELA07877.1 glutamine ABC transporter substrate binding and permease [Weissella ceti NC36]QVV91528.1 amino acid ABC transporter substrate-binding protein/permease [Weissella tructae]
MRKWLVSLGLSVMAVVGMMGAMPTGNADSKPHYTVATDTTYPPFEFQGDDGKYRGIDIDMLEAISKSEGFTYELKPMSFNAGVQAVQAKQIDGLLAGTAITDERKKIFDFGTPYYRTGVVAAISEKNDDIKTLDDLKGKNVAAKTGTAATVYAEEMAKKYGFTLTYFNDSNTMFNDVMVGNSVATFEDQPVMAYAIKQGLAMKIITEPAKAGWYGFSVKKGDNPEFLASFNAGYQKLVDSGEFDKIVEYYLGDTGYSYQEASAPKETTIFTLLADNKKALWNGLLKTLQLTFIGFILAALWGILLGVMGVSKNKFISGLSSTIVYIFRGLPMLVLAFFIYIGVPSLTGTKIPAFTAGIITLLLNEGAYIASFVKGSFLAVDKGQLEAARSLGLPYRKAMMKVVMPQGLRMMMPSFVNQFIITLKDTSLLSAIGIIELTQTGTLIIARNLQGFRVWVIIAIMYLLVITILTWISLWVEKRTK